MATTEQLMAQYGVAWFGFDESSGNVYDKLGLNNYVGIDVTATRTTGWNDDGNSLLFNGTSNSVSMNFGSNLLGELTFRFKIKINQNNNTEYVFATHNNATTQKGFNLCKLTGDTLRWNFFSEANQPSFVLNSPSKLTPHEWYDVMLSWDGRIGSFASMYINQELVAIIRAERPNNGSAYNLAIGRLSNALNGWWGGQLDDLQIYNKALSPSDFEQKRLVVNTIYNKNLVLSPTSARVKEIPNTAEYMMLAQGGVVREIDSAVDRPPIDFTKPTTEYELVTNNRTPLGKGRMFTIPIGTDFKTAMIEDNY
ncbi:LamG domain-containing protein [Lysinibacillus fusiformis]|uniref:LamG domain-containing protein n=1 Tax=Lysinibacillus fusiformis TaxID=28031 RepID=UPI00119F8236|nr:LamG domain-containing protein [Lysinibacillus fusiformis]